MRALASEPRLQILKWLKNPTAHFRPGVEGDIVDGGVCGVQLAKLLRISQLSEHMRVLSQAGLVKATRIKQWTFYQRDEKRIKELKRVITREV